ncbi:MAG: hypothetical protein EOO65_00675 [Methanosarcinales archaeon]|nr:MAG: hypothetical protein EOO65_00675 [Methanosarcinales archaeon]
MEPDAGQDENAAERHQGQPACKPRVERSEPSAGAQGLAEGVACTVRAAVRTPQDESVQAAHISPRCTPSLAVAPACSPRRAQGEVNLRTAFTELKTWCASAEFKLMTHTSTATGRTLPIICEWKQMFTQIGDNQSLLASLRDSPYFKPFAEQAESIGANLTTLDEGVQKLNGIQRRWVYLEPIFNRGALPSEQARFKRVDEQFREIMSKIGGNPIAYTLSDNLTFPNLLENLATMLEQLDRCQRALSNFLGTYHSACMFTCLLAAGMTWLAVQAIYNACYY